MPVFISHSSKDNAAVKPLVDALSALDIEHWIDYDELSAGQSFISGINSALDQCQAAIIVFSSNTQDSIWVKAEADYLAYASVQEGKTVIPVVIGDPYIPPLLRPLLRLPIHQVDEIAAALQKRSPAKRSTTGIHRVLITLLRTPDSGIAVQIHIGNQPYAGRTWPALPPSLIAAQRAFQTAARAGSRHIPSAYDRNQLEINLTELGRELAAVCLPDDSAEALTHLLDGSPLGAAVEIYCEANDIELLGLPFESLRLPDSRLLAIHPKAVLLRRRSGVQAPAYAPLAGPLKILAAVAAPDEDKTESAVLDQERELQNILDAVQDNDKVQVKILEVAHPQAIAKALQRDAYHVLHLSCHGSPGKLELEDEDGCAVPVTPRELLDPIAAAKRALPMVLLSSCHGGAHDGQTVSFAESLLRAGVPCVLAMQTAVTDYYATQLAQAFYENLAASSPALPSRALALARRKLEAARLTALQQPGTPLGQVQPEYATASLYIAGEEIPLANFQLPDVPLTAPPVHNIAGAVPQLRQGDLIGRRKELRETLRALRDPSRQYAGVVLTGIGGSGKSAIAGRVMQRLAEQGWLVPSFLGRFDLTGIALAIGNQLQLADRAKSRKVGEFLSRPNLDDGIRLQLITQCLSEEPILLVLDDFEQNLETGGAAFLDPDTEIYLSALASGARRGRLLITSRYSIPGFDALFLRVSVGPLSPAQTRKMLLRLPALNSRKMDELRSVLRLIDGHPRMLEFLDALLQGGHGHLTHVTQKLRQVLRDNHLDPMTKASDLQEGVQTTLMLGARDVFLEQLLTLAQREQTAEVLLQAACSNLRVTAAGVARMLDEDGSGDVPFTSAALSRLGNQSLVHQFSKDEFWVHRWTAEGLARMANEPAHLQRYRRAGRYRWWRTANESHSIEDAIEAVRNFLAGRDFDSATPATKTCIEALTRFQQSTSIAALASEVLEALPETHGDFAFIADEEAQAHLALGLTDRAFARYGYLLENYQDLVDAEPGNVDHQRQLSVAYEKIGDLYRDLGQGDQAHDCFLKSLAIRERLAQAEPARADYQRDLSVAYNKIGDLFRDLGQGDQARDSFLKSLAIRERLAQAEPARADYQRDLSVSYERIGDLYRVLGQGDQARDSILQSLAIAQRLAQAEPARADYQRDLSVSYNKIGDYYRDLGQGDQARDSFLQSLAIIERLAQAEPARADYQRDLFISYHRIGALYLALGQGYQARDSILQSLAIAQRLAQAEPARADYQRDLITALVRLAETDPSSARVHLTRALSIVESLKSTNRLNPVDEWMIPDLRNRLSKLAT